MTPEDCTTAAKIMRKYAAAVESLLFLKMSTSEARGEVSESHRLAVLLEEEAKNRQVVE